MSPRKQPISLFQLCVKSCVGLINDACVIIEKSYCEEEFEKCEHLALALKWQLMEILPASYFDVLLSERHCCRYRGDPRIQLHLLTHPLVRSFRKSHHDNGISQRFWLEKLPNLTRLVILNLEYICTDEILYTIGNNCLNLQEVNIVSRVDICKSPFNASVLTRNVSDTGLSFLTKCKQLRALALDPPRNEMVSRIGRCISQMGIVMLLTQLPKLEEVRIENGDVGGTILNCQKNIGPLSLKSISCNIATAAGIYKLVNTCPYLTELSIAHLTDSNKDDILKVISDSDLVLRKLSLSFFSFSSGLQYLLSVKGAMLTEFSLWDIENLLNLDAIATIGSQCPNLTSLCVLTQSNNLVISRCYRVTSKMFCSLKSLQLGYANFNIDHILSFFLDCKVKLERLTLRYQMRLNVDEVIMKLLTKGFFVEIENLWLDCTLEISKATVLKIIQSCNNLQALTVDYNENNSLSEIHRYIVENNLDLKLGSY